MSGWSRLGVAAGLAFLAYLPFLALPLISDDYIQIYLSRQYGPVDGWRSLAEDVLYRSRATSLLLTHFVDSWFGLDATAHRMLNVVVHAVNVGLVFLLGAWPGIGWRVSAAAAVFFAVHEGHQEAVVWSAALPELLVFTFGVGSLLAWMRGHSAWAAGLYALALFSKESALAVLPLMAWCWWQEDRGRRVRLAWLAGMAALSLVYAVAIFAAGREHLHLNDGTFSWSAPFWWTVPFSVHRLLWIWGWVALGLLVLGRAEKRMMGIALGWMVVTLLPYSFLTYMDRVPSRHVYLASAGLALLVGAAYVLVEERWQAGRRWLPVAAALLVVGHNLGYLWTKKYTQYERRAELTERFLRDAERHERPIVVTPACVAYGVDVYRYAVSLRLGGSPERVQERSASPDAVVYCDPEHP